MFEVQVAIEAIKAIIPMPRGFLYLTAIIEVHS